MTDFTVAELALELGVTRRTLDRQMQRGTIVPTRYDKGRATGYRTRHRGHYVFSAEYVEELKCRANEARSRGLSNVMAFTTSTGTTKTPSPAPELDAKAWAQQTMWKRKNATRNSSPTVTLASALAELLGLP